MSQSYFLQSGKNLMREQVDLKKDKIVRPEKFPGKIELLLTDWGGKITLDFVLENSGKFQNIQVYYDKGLAKKEYRKAWTKLQKGEYELHLSYVGDSRIIFK